MVPLVSELVVAAAVVKGEDAPLESVCAVTHVDSLESTGLCIEDNTFIATPRKLVSSSETERVLNAQVAYLPYVHVLVKAFLVKCNYIRKRTHDWLSKDWLTRATNWAKFSATTGLGVIRRGHLEQWRSLMPPPYFLQKTDFHSIQTGVFIIYSKTSYKSQIWGLLANSETKIISASPPPTDFASNQDSGKAILGEELASISTKRRLLQDMQAPTPDMINQNDLLDDDEAEPLNENDSDNDLDDVDQGEELNTHHLVFAQFDNVYDISTRNKSDGSSELKAVQSVLRYL
ncbi:transcription factor IIA, alpha/beta subunit [Tanacetum coccineum]